MNLGLKSPRVTLEKLRISVEENQRFRFKRFLFRKFKEHKGLGFEGHKFFIEMLIDLS